MTVVFCVAPTGNFFRWQLKHDEVPGDGRWSENSFDDFIELLRRDERVSGCWKLVAA